MATDFSRNGGIRIEIGKVVKAMGVQYDVNALDGNMSKDCQEENIMMMPWNQSYRQGGLIKRRVLTVGNERGWLAKY